MTERVDGATKEHDGQIKKSCPSLPRKIFRLTRRANQRYQLARPARQGALAIVTNARRDAVDADVPLTNGTEAYGEVVWFWRPDAGVKFVRSKLLAGDGGKKAGHRGERVISCKTIARGRPECFR
jgi:hypothetical protein